jgi:hypothetical protein
LTGLQQTTTEVLNFVELLRSTLNSVMKTPLAAVTGLAGSLLLAPLTLGPTQAGSAPDLKESDSQVTSTRRGGKALVQRTQLTPLIQPSDMALQPMLVQCVG